jgi:nitroimidazol reductase NimA-like FMN-containing flavoprotein (pyridoxamine 5'-phosphate oxidase superfamily)
MPAKWLTESEAFGYLAARTEGHMATVDASGQPYIIPLNYIFFRGSIYFHCASRGGHKLDNIAADSRVCFEVSQTDKSVFAEKACNCATRYTSVVVFGKARIVDSAEEKLAVMTALTDKFAAGRPYQPLDVAAVGSCTVVAVSVDKITGKRNVDPA